MGESLARTSAAPTGPNLVVKMGAKMAVLWAGHWVALSVVELVQWTVAKKAVMTAVTTAVTMAVRLVAPKA